MAGRLAAGWLASLALYLPAIAVAEAPADDVLLPLLRGEFALQEGRSAEAAAFYLQAAQASDDPALAERAARIAVMSAARVTGEQALARWQQLQPDADALPAMRALHAVRSGDPSVALEALQAMLAAPEGWKDALRLLAAEPAGLGTAALVAALAESPQFPAGLEPLLALGELAKRQDLDALAATLAERATTAHAGSARAWLWRAQVARDSGEPDVAREAVDTALALPTLDASTRLVAAAQLDALGDPAAAAAALAFAEQDDMTLMARAAYLSRADDPPALAALYATIVGQTTADAPAARRYLLGQLAELIGDHDAALGWYRGLETGVEHEQAQLRIAILQDQAGAAVDALATLHALQRSDSENGAVLVDAYLLEAELLRRRGEAEQMERALNRGLAVFEDEPELLYARALAAERGGRVDAALADLRRLVALDPDNADALNALGYTLADRTGDYQEALELISRALAMAPDSAAILDSMGWVLHKLGRSNEGLVHLQRSFELNPDAEVAAHLGEVLWLLGRPDDARRIWQQGGEVDADNRALQAALERFDP